MPLKYTHLPKCPGVYIMKNANGQVIYIGKASSLKTRVSSYFQKAHDVKTELLVRDIAAIDYEQTDSVLEATFREAELIKKYQPKYNIQQKDDRSFIYIGITKDVYPRVLMIRGRDLNKTSALYRITFGPFTSAHLLRSLLKLVGKMVPFSTCKPPSSTNSSQSYGKVAVKPCFYYHLGQCRGVCTGEITKADYQKIIRNLVLFFQGKKNRVMRNLKREMRELAKQEKFEAAAKIRNQLYNLKHINDTALLKREPLPTKGSFKRIEGYDASTISGTSATGSMVVFENGEPNKAEYRKFKIKTVHGADDVQMIKEILLRRLKHTEWHLPDLILIDGGQAQISGAEIILKQKQLFIPLIGIAKGPKRKRVDFHYSDTISEGMKKSADEHKETLIRVRDEAHRFALSYHRVLRQSRRD